MPTCGKCHKLDQTVEHIRICFGLPDFEVSGFVRRYLERDDFKPMAMRDDD